MKPKILITANMVDGAFEPLIGKFEIILPPRGVPAFSYDQIFSQAEDVDAILSMFFTPKIDALIIKKAKKLKIISQFGVGYDNIDVQTARECGIAVCNTPDPVTEPTAELAMGLIYDLSRRITENDRLLRANKIKWGVLDNMGYTLFGKTLGIIGMGRIGQALARRAHAAGMKIVYHNRKRLSTQIEWLYDATYVSKDELLSISDVVSLNAPAATDTKHIISKKELSAMKPSAILINTARGTLLDEDALINALRSNTIRGAGLDVYEKGDGNVSPELLTMSSVVIVPHIGTQTIDTRIDMGLYASQNIINFFDGKEPLSRID